MDQPTTSPAPATDLTDAVAGAVLSIPGVLRLEPNLQSSLHRLRTRVTQHLSALHSPDPTAAAIDGITITRQRRSDGDPTTHISIDIATSAAAQARQVATAVHNAVTTRLDLHGQTAEHIRVNVLSIEPDES